MKGREGKGEDGVGWKERVETGEGEEEESSLIVAIFFFYKGQYYFKRNM